MKKLAIFLSVFVMMTSFVRPNDQIFFQNIFGSNQVDFINSEELDGENAWLFLKDEILLVPGYLSAIVSLPTGFAGAVGGLKFVKWLGKKEKKDGEEKKGEGFFEEKFGKLSGFAKAAFMVGGTVGSWKLVKCGTDVLCYAYFVNRFLKNYKVNRNKIPKKMVGFFDEEYKAFSKSGKFGYLKRVKRVVDVVKAAVAWHEDKQELPEPSELSELPFPEEQIPEEQIPGEQIPGEQIPGEQIPGEQIPEEPTEQVEPVVQEESVEAQESLTEAEVGVVEAPQDERLKPTG